MRFLKVILLCGKLALPSTLPAQTNTNPVTRETVINAEKLFGLDFSEPKIDQLLPGLKEQLGHFRGVRKFSLSNSVPPALLFNPIPVKQNTGQPFSSPTSLNDNIRPFVRRIR